MFNSFSKLNWWSPNSEQLSWLLRNVVQLSLNFRAGGTGGVRGGGIAIPNDSSHNIFKTFFHEWPSLTTAHPPLNYRTFRRFWIYAGRVGSGHLGQICKRGLAGHAWKDGLNKTWISISKIQLSIIFHSGMFLKIIVQNNWFCLL